jgi:hypothetical protein
LRGITFVSDILIHGVGYIQNFTVKVQNALVKKAVVITAGHVNGVFVGLSCFYLTLELHKQEGEGLACNLVMPYVS